MSEERLDQEEYRKREKDKLNAFIQSRERLMMKLWKDEDLYRNYLQLQTRLPESPANTVWCARVKPDAVMLNTYTVWKSLGETVKTGEKGIKAVGKRRSYSKKFNGASQRGYRVIYNYDYSQLDNPSFNIQNPVQLSPEEFLSKLDPEFGKQELSSNGIAKDEFACLWLASFVGKNYLEGLENNVSNIDMAGKNIGYMLCYRFLEEVSFSLIEGTQLHNDRFKDMSWKAVNSELHAIRDGFKSLEKRFE